MALLNLVMAFLTAVTHYSVHDLEGATGTIHQWSPVASILYQMAPVTTLQSAWWLGLRCVRTYWMRMECYSDPILDLMRLTVVTWLKEVNLRESLPCRPPYWIGISRMYGDFCRFPIGVSSGASSSFGLRQSKLWIGQTCNAAAALDWKSVCTGWTLREWIHRFLTGDVSIHFVLDGD